MWQQGVDHRWPSSQKRKSDLQFSFLRPEGGRGASHLPTHWHIRQDEVGKRRPSTCSRWWPYLDWNCHKWQMPAIEWPWELALLWREDHLPSSKQSTCAGGGSLDCHGYLSGGQGPPNWEISGRQGEWHLPLSELCLACRWVRFCRLAIGVQMFVVGQLGRPLPKDLGLS